MSGTLVQWVESAKISVEVIHDYGTQVDDDGWEHHKYDLRLSYQGRTFNTPWSQGMRVETSPIDTPWLIIENILCSTSEVVFDPDITFEEWAGNLGYDTDSRRAERTFQAVKDEAERFVPFIGGQAEYERIAQLLEQ